MVFMLEDFQPAFSDTAIERKISGNPLKIKFQENGYFPGVIGSRLERQKNSSIICWSKTEYQDGDPERARSVTNWVRNKEEH